MNESWLWWGGGIAAVSALIAPAWRYLLMGWSYLCALIIVRAEYRSTAGIQVLQFLLEEAWIPQAGITRKYDATVEYIRSLKAMKYVPYEIFPISMRIGRYRWAPFTLQVSTNSEGEIVVTIVSARYLFDRDKLLYDAVKKQHAEEDAQAEQSQITGAYMIIRVFGKHHTNGRQDRLQGGDVPSSKGAAANPYAETPDQVLKGYHKLRRYIGWDKDDISIYSDDTRDPFDSIAMSEEAETAIKRIENWLRRRKWYEEREVPWKMGVCLYGPPGNGKTAWVLALARKYGFTVFVLDLASMDNEELQEAWSKARCYGRSIILLEDFDSYFNKREPKNPNLMITFDALLNAIDGIQRSGGILTVITTNDPESLDPALGSIGVATRPGRIDYMVEFKPPDADGLRKIATRILKDNPEIVENVVREGLDNGMSGAQFELCCLNHAYEVAHAA